MDKVIFIIISYFIGAIPVGFLLAKYIKGVDIRSYGSKNIGATNVNRVLGKKLGAITLVLDMAKSFLVVWASQKLGFSEIIVSLVAWSILLGNCFSIFLGFKGGKGVATTFGIMLAVSPAVFLAGTLIWGLFWKITKISAIGSLASMVATPFAAYFWLPAPYFYLFLMISLLVIFRHKINIQELRQKYIF